MKLLENKVAIITGASSGIGRATAMLFAAEGAAVVINARGEKALHEVAADIREAGGRVHTVAGDAGVAESERARTGGEEEDGRGIGAAGNGLRPGDGRSDERRDERGSAKCHWWGELESVWRGSPFRKSAR